MYSQIIFASFDLVFPGDIIPQAVHSSFVTYTPYNERSRKSQHFHKKKAKNAPRFAAAIKSLSVELELH